MKKSVHVHVPTAKVLAIGGSAVVWATSCLAGAWLEDARNEVSDSAPIGAKRREILFAVCAAESYILEWVRDDVLNGDYPQLEEYFPSGSKRGVIEKWRHLPKQLHTDGRISEAPDWSGSEWLNLRRLIAFRDGLVHARASLPDGTEVSAARRPFPTGTQLNDLSSGWAVGVVVDAIDALHRAANTTPPSWVRGA